jgi:hypothetical protein
MNKSLPAMFAVLAVSAFAQEYRGTISGSITDPTSAPVSGAQVNVIETHTNARVQLLTQAAGEYTAAALLPGDYDIDVKLQGFKQFTRKAVHVGAGEHPIIDIQLQVGDATQTVEVTADAPLINSENASVGQAITTKEVEDLPLNGGTPLVLASLSIGVLGTGQPGLIHPFDAGGAAGWSIGGSAAQTNEILINGSPDSTWDGRLAYSPPKDAVQEVRVKAFDTDAGFGHTGGGTVNQILKSGGNQFHGTLQELNQPNTLTANSFFNNKAGLPNPVTHYNQYGATIGGPIIVPKLYNGKDKLFFEFAWESLKDSQPNTTFLTVPTAAERQGDFSALLPLGSAYQLYNPFSGVLNGTAISRTAYPGNIIPKSQINPVSLALLNYFPLPNVTATRPDGFDNYGNTAPTTDNYNNYFGRLDYNMSDRNRLFFDVRRTDYSQVKNNYFGNQSTGSLLTRENWGSELDDVITLNAANILDLHLNFTRLAESHPSPSAGFDPTTLGLPSYIASNSLYPQLPSITFSNNTGLQALGSTGANVLPSQSLQFYGTWTAIKGNHTIRAGADLRQYRLNTTTYGNSSGAFSFSANTFVRASNTASATTVSGQDLATFLLGVPTSGSYDVAAAGSYYQYYSAGFVQDDWRVRRNLTVNVGLRFDHDGPYHEKYGRSLNGFDATDPSPLAAAATAAYNKNPISQIPVGSFNVLGGPTFASRDNNAIYNTTSHLFSPRAGVAWTPDILGGKTSIRAGFGMFVSPIVISSFAITGAYSTNPILTQEGFTQTTPYTASTNNNLSPATTLSNPFPGGIQQPVGSAQGLNTFTGQTLTVLNPNMSNPYSLRWNMGFQQELFANTVLEVVYLGNHSLHLPIYARQVNNIPRQYLSTLPTRDQATVSALTATAQNPFNGLIAGGTPSGATTNVAQLLSKYPQYPTGTGSESAGVLLDNDSSGSSAFESINVRVSKRFSKSGVSLIGNYIHSKLIERDSFLNDTDPQPEKRVSSFDHPNRFVTAITYDLPFGRNAMFDLHSRFANAVVGGWKLNGIYTYQTGQPIVWANGSTATPGDYIYYRGPVNVNSRQTNTVAFDTTQFNTNAAQQLQYHIRTFSTTFGNLRQDGINQLDASTIKEFHPTEKTVFQFRFEVFNALNHASFAAPNTTATNASFGLITAQANRQRAVQIGARFAF